MPVLERIGNQRPRLSHLPANRASSALEEAVDLAASCGLILDDWQTWVLDNMLGERLDGRWAASQCVLIVPRQSGKNSVLEALELAALFLFNEKRIIHTAQLADTAAAHMQRMVDLIASNPELDAITHPYWSNGKERIQRTDKGGGRIEFVTRGTKTKRGASPQRVVFDEAMFLTDEQMGAIMPGLSAQSMNKDGGPQIIYTSSAPFVDSVVLHRVRELGIAAASATQFFAEWSCAEGVDPNNRDAWYEANPGLGVRISEEWIEEELSTLSREVFLTERLGVVPAADGPSRVLANWAACRDAESMLPRTPKVVALSVGVGGVSASLSVCGPRSDGVAHIELTSPDDPRGTWWIVDECLKATKALRCKLTVDPRSPTAGVLEMLRAAGVPLQELTTADYVEACAALQVAVQNLKVRHIGQPELDAAVAGADIRIVGDGGWAWSRKSSAVNIAPLESTTLALWAYSKAKKPRARYINLNAVLAAAEAVPV